MRVGIRQAKAQLSRLIESALMGEEVTIARAGHPVVRLIPIQKPKPVLGSARGTIQFQPGWDDPLTDKGIEELFGQD